MAESSMKICNLCCHESTAWAVGECDHPTCLRCTAKLRVLCDQRDCPVCRLKLDVVIVCSEIKPFSKISRSRYQGDRKHGIFFESRELHHLYETLQQYICSRCESNEVFRTFKQLRDHMKKVHDLYHCEICVENLKQFPTEFKVYSRPMLTKHRRDGDPDDSSHRGHPLCRFCDIRYLDNDVLHAHLRTDHFWCHICESDGKQDYYKNYPLLRQHFKEEHYLCEEGACREEKLTSVFRSKIDLQAHRASTHTRGLSKAEVKQLRQVELGFSYGGARQEGGARGVRSAPHLNSRSGRTAQRKEQEQFEVAAALSASMQPAEPKKPKKPTQSSLRKSPSEETKPPPGFANYPAKANHQHLELTNGIVEPTVFKSNTNTSLASKATSITTGLARPPGFENMPALPRGETKENEWPEIVSREASIDDVAGERSHASELTSLQNPSMVTATPSGVWLKPKNDSKSEKYEQKSSRKKKKSSERTLPSEAFPSLPGKSQSSSEKIIADESSVLLTRKQVEGKVVEKIREILNKSDFTTFKTLSGWYRNSEISASEYMDQCSSLFGPKWTEIGPKVAFVFPNQQKKDELSKLFQTSETLGMKTKPSVWSSQTPHRASRRPPRGMLDDADYPSLSTASALAQGTKISSATGAWNMIVRS